MILSFKFLVYLFCLGFFLFVLSSNAVFGLESTYESFVSTEASKIEFKGEFSGGQFGAVLNSGDLNGDGVDDLVVGAPFTSTDGKQWNGATRIIFGGADEPDTVISGENSGDQLGTSLAVGDFNGDGIDDLVIGAHQAYFKGKKSGKLYLIYGRNDLANQIIDFALQDPDVSMSRGLDGAYFGISLHSTDLNGDYIDDLLVGAPLSSSSKFDNSGLVYGYFGSMQGISQDYNFLIFGQSSGERFGSSIVSEDFNDDGKNDVLSGAYQANTGSTKNIGKLYFFELPPPHIIVIQSQIETFKGQNKNEFFGFDLDSGELNGDGIVDLAVTSFPYAGEKTDAKVSIYYGGSDMAEPDIVIKNPRGDALIGASVLLTDLNADGLDDIVIGAPGISYSKSEEPGEVYIIFSSEEGYKSEYSVADFEVDNIIHGENADDWFGYSLTSLDYNNDGIEDLAVGSRYSDTENGVNNGKVFVLLGNNGPYGAVKSMAINNENMPQELSRGELIKIVMKNFNLKEKKAAYIQNCYEYIDFCLFNFMAMSSFNGIDLGDEMLLYPDVKPGDKYYEDINTATILGLINGYLNEPESPFKPAEPVTRIQALKIVLGAADLVPSKYKFELVAMLGSYLNLINQSSAFGDIDSKISHMWWYPRYVNFAVEHGIVDKGDYFRPDDKITSDELSDMINRTLDYINSQDAQATS